MSKTVGIILTVAAVAFAIAVPVFGLAALGLTAAAASAIAAALSAAIMINGLLMPKGTSAPELKDRQASQVTLQLGEQPRSSIFGIAATGGSLVDAFNWGGDYGTDWEAVVIALADHKCEGLTGFYVNDTFVAYTADGVVPGYNGQLEVYFRSGDLVQTLPSIVTTNGPGWAATDYGAGVCHVVVAYKADAPDAENPVWPGGRPRFLWVPKGKRCYDPRNDSTVAGGSGTHRWTDPTTWTWSDNPIVCRYNWARGVYAGDQVASPDMLLVGRGLSSVEQPPANLFAPANLCDELVDGEAQFQIGAAIYSNERFLDVETRFASAVAGVILTREGAVEIEPAQAKAVAASFTDDDLMVGGEVQWNEGILSDADSEWVNTVIPHYVEPTQRWGDHSAPVRRDTADVVADRGPREETIAMDMVTRAVQAGVTGETHRRMGRLWGRASVPLPPRFAELEEGDWVEWTSVSRFGGAAKTFRIQAFGMDEKWQSRHQLREIAASVFTGVPGLSDLSNPYAPTPAPSLVTPSATDWTLTAQTIDAIEALHLAGAVTMSAADAVIFEHRAYVVGQADDVNWISDGTEAANVTLKNITGLAGGVDYQVSVRYRVSGELTPRRILGPVTTGGVSVTALIAESFTTGLLFQIDDTGHVSLSDHSRIYPDKAVSVQGKSSVSGITATRSGSIAAGGTTADGIYIYYDDQARAGGAVTYQSLLLTGNAGDASPAFASPTNPYRHFVCFGEVPAAGSVTSGGSDVGSGGGAAGDLPCVAEDTPQLMANAERNGPGEAKPIGEAKVGEWIWTRHHLTGEWGAFQIVGHRRSWEPVYRVPSLPRATKLHRTWCDEAAQWAMLHADGEPDGHAWVIKETVAEAHTYFTPGGGDIRPEGVLNHNIKPAV